MRDGFIPKHSLHWNSSGEVYSRRRGKGPSSRRPEVPTRRGEM